ncbi:MAG: adenylate/guanylate cyclase domain-containing protein [Planctomycetes bacterium]|nr:adenylate/guanylate cyclase domain-containing protein [Planctomycetota bacterium]
MIEEIKRLRRELAEKEGGSAAPSSSDSEPMMRSIVGLQEKVIQLDEKDHILYINSALAKELALPRAAVRGLPVVEIDRFRWGPGLLSSLVAQARKLPEGREAVREVAWHDPEKDQDVHYRVKGTIEGGKSQILIEDITSLRNIEKVFARFVSPPIIEKMKEMGKDFFRAERYEMTVLFADLRGFTTFSERLQPEEVRGMLNEYLTGMIEIIFRHGATLDKVVGDEVMAIFGAPLYYEDHALRALSVAIEMQAAHATLAQKWAAQGREALGLGIGFNTGEMVVGNVGSERAMNYTVIGHHVNLASRLCSQAKAGEILMGQTTFERIKDALTVKGAHLGFRVKFRKTGQVQMKGLSAATDVIQAVVQNE